MGLSCIFPLKATPLKIKTLKPIHIHWKNWNQTSEDKKKTSIKTNPLICIYDYIDMCINIYIYIQWLRTKKQLAPRPPGTPVKPGSSRSRSWRDGASQTGGRARTLGPPASSLMVGFIGMWDVKKMGISWIYNGIVYIYICLSLFIHSVSY